MPFMSSSVTRDPHCRLIVVCVLFGVLSLTVVRPGLPLGWDELVYASRFTPYGPETPFSAPRTRGVPLLIAPVAAFTDSVAALRCYLTVTASLALYLGYRPWLRVFQERGPQPEPSGRSEGAGGTGGVGGVVPLAAGFYGSVWFALFYAGSAMPNHYVAMGLAAAVGCFVRADLTTSTSSTPSTSRTSRTPTSRLCAGIGAGLAVAALMRPNDAVWPALALLAVALWAVARSGERGRPRGRWAWIAGAVAAERRSLWCRGSWRLSCASGCRRRGCGPRARFKAACGPPSPCPRTPPRWTARCCAGPAGAHPSDGPRSPGGC